jgi:hypothetical protein
MGITNDWHIELEFDQIHEFDPGKWIVSRSRDGDPSGYHSVVVDRFGPHQYEAALASTVARARIEGLRAVESESDGTKAFLYIPPE